MRNTKRLLGLRTKESSSKILKKLLSFWVDKPRKGEESVLGIEIVTYQTKRADKADEYVWTYFHKRGILIKQDADKDGNTWGKKYKWSCSCSCCVSLYALLEPYWHQYHSASYPKSSSNGSCYKSIKHLFSHFSFRHLFIVIFKDKTKIFFFHIELILFYSYRFAIEIR